MDDKKIACIADTNKHRDLVRLYMDRLADTIKDNGERHDQSKLEEPELSTFAEYGPKLKETKFPSLEYNKYLKEMNKGLDHHYANNRHHPQHFADGISGMNLLDIIEMVCDWVAAGKRMKDSSFEESVEFQAKRFGISDQLRQIILNSEHIIVPPDVYIPPRIKLESAQVQNGVIKVGDRVLPKHAFDWEKEEGIEVLEIFRNQYGNIRIQCAVFPDGLGDFDPSDLRKKE